MGKGQEVEAMDAWALPIPGGKTNKLMCTQTVITIAVILPWDKKECCLTNTTVIMGHTLCGVHLATLWLLG